MDTAKFDVQHNAAIFSLLISAYEVLPRVWSERIEVGQARIPLPLKIFFIVLSLS